MFAIKSKNNINIKRNFHTSCKAQNIWDIWAADAACKNTELLQENQLLLKKIIKQNDDTHTLLTYIAVRQGKFNYTQEDFEQLIPKVRQGLLRIKDINIDNKKE